MNDGDYVGHVGSRMRVTCYALIVTSMYMPFVRIAKGIFAIIFLSMTSRKCNSGNYIFIRSITNYALNTSTLWCHPNCSEYVLSVDQKLILHSQRAVNCVVKSCLKQI